MATGVIRRVRVDALDWEEAGQVFQGLAALERTRGRLAPETPTDPDGTFRQAFGELARPPRERNPDDAALRAYLAELLRSVPAGIDKVK